MMRRATPRESSLCYVGRRLVLHEKVQPNGARTACCVDIIREANGRELGAEKLDFKRAAITRGLTRNTRK